jgi:HTH-type transcriptional regulator/antitoxin HigA
MSKATQYDPDYAVPPGETLQETIDQLGLTQNELAERTGLTTKTINLIIKGEAPITAESALLFERVTGVPASFWNNLETNYRERLARLAARSQMEEQVEWVRRFSYQQMVNLRLVEAANDPVQRVDNLVRFFAVASSREWESTYTELAGAARESKQLLSDLGDLSAWLRAGEILAQKRACADYERSAFEKALQEIRGLTRENPAAIWPRVEQLCAAAGVAVVLVPELPKTHIYGFTRWLTPRKALIQLSLRYKTDDMLWFTFFHEAAHILLHGKKDVFLECRDCDGVKEDEANRWASEFLVPDKRWQSFIAAKDPPVPEREIRAFADEQGIAPSIVLGRLQHRAKLVGPGQYNHLKRHLDIVWQGLDPVAP